MIGPGVIKSSPTDLGYISRIAQLLADRFEVELSADTQYSLNDVVTRILAGRKVEAKQVYATINNLIARNEQQPLGHIHQLARISHFNLFMTTTFDRTLESAINRVRFGGSPRTTVCEFSLKKNPVDDLPDWKKDLGPCLYYLHGRVSVFPRSFAIWDADAIDFTLHLHDRLKDGKSLPRLLNALRTFDLLILGVNLTDWLARFFLRVVRQDNPLSDPEYAEYLAESEADVAESFVTYCCSARRGTHILACEPIAFVSDLYERWEQRYGPGDEPSAAVPFCSARQKHAC